MIFGNTFVVLTKLASCHQTTLSFPSRHVPILRCDRYVSRWDPLTAAIPWVLGEFLQSLVFGTMLIIQTFVVLILLRKHDNIFAFHCIPWHWNITNCWNSIFAVFVLHGIPQFHFHCHLTQCSEPIAIFYCFYFVLSAYKGRYFQIFPTLSSLYWQMSSLAGNWSQGYFLLIKYST